MSTESRLSSSADSWAKSRPRSRSVSEATRRIAGASGMSSSGSPEDRDAEASACRITGGSSPVPAGTGESGPDGVSAGSAVMVCCGAITGGTPCPSGPNISAKTRSNVST